MIPLSRPRVSREDADLPCDVGYFRIKICMRGENVNVNTYLLFLKYSYNEGGSMNDVKGSM